MSCSYTTTVADAVRNEMAELGVSQSELARHLGVTQPSVSRRLSGSQSFTIAELELIAAVLGIPLARLLPRHEARRVPPLPAVAVPSP